MTKFTAGRFVAEVFPGPQNGRATTLIELHRNGSGERVAALDVDVEDLPDLRHVLDRAIVAHLAEWPARPVTLPLRLWACACGGDSSTGHKPNCGIAAMHPYAEGR